MAVVSIYSTNPEIRRDLAGLLAEVDRDALEPVCAECFLSFRDFLDSGRQNRRRILLLAQEGAGSVELAATAVEECPYSPVIWLSDLDFALFSYRLEVSHFGFLPATEENLRIALRNCRNRPGDAKASARAQPSLG